MSLVTRCSNCATTFRVSAVQLSARGGKVRCGKCSTVFDGVANLLADEAVARLPEEPTPQLGLFEAGSSSARTADEIVAGAASQSLRNLPDPVVPVSADTTAQAMAGLNSHAEKPAEPADPATPLPDFLTKPKPSARFLVLWGLLSVIAVLGLSAQLVYHFRTQFSVLVPEARGPLETICDMIGCELRLPQRADLMSIESSDLQADPQRTGVIVLNALLRNRAPFPQEFPALELTLTDDRDQPLVRRVLNPADYAAARIAAIRPGIAGGAEESVRIFIDTGRVRATGYRLYLFYP